jgi:hypothetical protein
VQRCGEHVPKLVLLHPALRRVRSERARRVGLGGAGKRDRIPADAVALMLVAAKGQVRDLGGR